jgi:hypothetical protein
MNPSVLQKTPFGESLFSFLVPWAGRSNAHSEFIAASLCNRLAKLARGRTRADMYRLKNKCLRRLIAADDRLIDVLVDKDRFPGLLSIRLRIAPKLSLHSHENWLDAA